MKLSIYSKILISLCIVAIIGYAGFMIWQSSDTDKNTICVGLDVKLLDESSARFISEHEIAKLLDSKGLNPVGNKYKIISTEAIERELLRNELIRTTECFKTISGKVVVEVTQRTPKFLIVGNQSYYVDSDRKLMPVSLNYAAYVPVVSGRVLRRMATREIFDFVSYLEKDTFWNAQIEQIFVRDDLKVELIPRVGNAVVLLGSFDNFEKKLRNLRELYTQGFNVVGWNRYDKIDLQYDGQVVCTITGTKPIIVIRPDTVGVKDSTKMKENIELKKENISSKKEIIAPKKENNTPKKENIVRKKESIAHKKESKASKKKV
jgi:cell division protein FtsQ